MNSAEAYRKLFAAFASGAKDEFFKVAEDIIEEEENKHNNKLAKDLRHFLYNGNLRKVFDFIERGKWVVFFDEFDAIGKERNSPFEHGEMKRVVNSFLQMWDNFEGESLIIAATNHQHLLDPALWRRFDELIYFGVPDTERQIRIYKMYLRPTRTKGIDLDYFADKTDGMSPADIEMICLNDIKEVILSGKKSLT